MTDTAGVTFTAVTAAERRLLEGLIREYYAFDGHRFDPTVVTAALAEIAAADPLVHAWIIRANDAPVVYLVVTLGFSIESGGRDAFIDELYLRPAFRNRGIGRCALRRAEESCRRLGVKVVNLEVERRNSRAQALYRAAGYRDHDRYLMSKRLDVEEPPPKGTN